MQKIGKVTLKRYKCKNCGFESMYSTNHYGSIYPKCSNCGWKHPMMMGQIHECLEPLPEGWEKPEEWKIVKLSDVCEISEVKEVKR